MKQDNRKKKFEEFLGYFNKYIQGNEKGEGQIFFEHLLQAFGNPGIKEVGATCEELIKKREGKRGFADFIWEPRVIIELKKEVNLFINTMIKRLVIGLTEYLD